LKFELLPAIGVTVAPTDALPAPCTLLALTLQVYAVPLLKPVTVIGLALPDAVCVFAPAVQVAV
jgi:hypothetical protein